MHYLDLKTQLSTHIIFSLQDIRKLEPKFYRARLNEWQNKGYIKKIIKKYYIFSDLKINEQVLFLIANKIYGPSYISLEMALAYYSLIPESVYNITSVTSRHTHTFQTTIGDFSYRHLKSEYLFGYQLVDHQDHRFKIAEPAKAILDYFYFHAQLKNEEDFYELRFNKEQFWQIINQDKLNHYLQTFRNRSLSKRIQSFLTFLNHA